MLRTFAPSGQMSRPAYRFARPRCEMERDKWTYGYKRRNYKHRFERFQHMSNKPVKICPLCGGGT